MTSTPQLLFAREKAKLVKKLMLLCGSDENVGLDEDSKEDILFHCSISCLPVSRAGRIGFHLVKIRAPRFSGFIVKPNKTSDLLEEGLDAAKDIYSGQNVTPALVFEVDGDLFVYSEVVPDYIRGADTHPFIQLRSHNRVRRIYELKRFLSALGMSCIED
jgi:hypothetical protein